MKIMEYITHSEKETKELLLNILDLKPNSKKATVFALEGELGSGKTTFVKGLEEVLKIKIKSPTFNIIKRYEIDFNGFKNFYHIDFYRVKSVSGLEFEDILNKKENLIFIEWGSNIEESLPKDIKKICFEYLDKDKRKITYEGNKNN